MSKLVEIRFEGVETWEENRENVDKKLQELTGTNEYPSTRTMPPIILGVELDDNGIEQLREINGVIVHVSKDDE